jgi:sugar phosphate isomerase/epimerase
VSLPVGLRIPPKIGAQGLETVARWAPTVGLGALDLPNVDAEAKATLERNGLVLGSVDAAGVGDLLSRDPARRERGAAALRARIDATAQAGGRSLFACLVPGERDMGRREGYELWAEVFPPLVEYAEGRGVSFALEGWPGGAPVYPTVGYTPEIFRAMFRHCPSPALGLCYDPSHLVRLGIDHIRFLDEFGSRIRHCHGKDTELLPDGQYLYGWLPAILDRTPGFSEGPWRYCVPGDGTVNWARVAYRLEQHGYSGPISIELEDARYWGSLEKEQQGVAKAARHLLAHAQ